MNQRLHRHDTEIDGKQLHTAIDIDTDLAFGEEATSKAFVDKLDLVVDHSSCHFVSPNQIRNMYQTHEHEPDTTSI